VASTARRQFLTGQRVCESSSLRAWTRLILPSLDVLRLRRGSVSRNLGV
jgi:hypothetical protein